MKTTPPWQRPERWLAFVLTFLGVCSFLAIVPVSQEAAGATSLVETASPQDDLSFIDYLREGAREVQEVGHWTSLLPPLIAVLVAAFFRTMVGALVTAIAVGSLLSYGLNPLATAVLGVSDYLVSPALTQFGAMIILFLFSLIGMVHVMSRSGGLSGLVSLVSKVAKNRRRAKVAIGLGGLAVFFDDYTNAVVLGATMRRLSDRFRISREKLAYLVDSTTAPVAGLALLSTWVAFEVYLLGEVSEKEGVAISGYGLLVEMLPMRFYCIGTLIFLFLTSATGRDFGPMYKAERRAFEIGSAEAAESGVGLSEPLMTEEESEESPERWINAVIPILVVISSVVIGILLLGSLRLRSGGASFSWFSFADWRAAFSVAVFDPNSLEETGALPVLLAASILGGLVAVLMPVAQRILSVETALSSYARGLPKMWTAILILAMTWSMREICDSLGTAEYLIALMGESMPLWILPLFSFLLAAGMSFATGSSWGAMGILLPILMPLAVKLGATQEDMFYIYLLTASAILDGAIFGDHCSPISDTTVLSSLSSGCDHIAHVNTQVHYAGITVALSCLFGYLFVGNGLPVWGFYFLFPLGAYGFLFLFGKRSDFAIAEADAS